MPLANHHESNLVHLIYVSKAGATFDDTYLVDMLASIKKKNSLLGISGMLLHVEGSFFQVLEGEESKILKLFETISVDDRHKELTKVIYESIRERSFPEWTMGFASKNTQEMKELEGMNDFFIDGNCLAKLDRGRTKKLLEAFRRGRWRLN